MVDCDWKFTPFKKENWVGVSGSFMAMRDRWYCSTHHIAHYGGAEEPPKASLCSDELRVRADKERLAARRRRWWLFKTLPKRLWQALRGEDVYGYCPRCSSDE